MKYTGKIIDAHMHLWDYQSGNYPWLDSELPGADKMIGDYKKLRRNYFVENYRNDIDGSNIDKAVHVQVFGYPENPVLETKWLQKQSKLYQFPDAIVAFADLTTNVDETLENHSLFSNLRGIRNVLCYHENQELRMINDPNIFFDKKWQYGFSLLEKYKLSFDVQIFDHQVLDLLRVADKYCNTIIVLEHLAWPLDLSQEGFKKWRTRIREIAKLENVMVKISALGCVFKKFDKGLISPYIFELIESFGAERCMFGSNFPVDGLFISFDRLYDFYGDLVASVSLVDQEKMFYLNAKQIYRV